METNNKIQQRFLWIALLALIFIAVATIYFNNLPPQGSTGQVQNVEQKIILSIDGLFKNKEVFITGEETILDVLKKIDAVDQALKLSTKDFKDLGTLVDAMGVLKNGTDKKYWQYKVDGVMPQIGADKYKLKGGEKVDWIFTASEF